MTNFIILPNQHDRAPFLLVSRVHGFAASPEYQGLVDYELEIPGVVAAAFAKYLARIHTAESSSRDSEIDVQKAIASAHETLETLASSPGTDIRNLIAYEIFENLDDQPEVLEKIKTHLKPHALAIYDEWSSKLR